MPIARSARHVAFVTYPAEPGLTADDALVLEPLAALGVGVRAVQWDDERAAWSDFDAVVLRSCWDYHLRDAEFGAWLDHLAATGARVWNPLPVLQWNRSKHYLADLEARGIATVPTAWIPRGARETLAAIHARTGWADLVVKPAVSAAGHETSRVDAGATRAADDEAFARLVASSDVMVQRFLPEIERDGELSFVFFAGALSHVVRKQPRTGDFRVQPHFGGTTASVTAPPCLVDEAARILACAPGPHLYARVDACVVDGRLLLMELELLEPSLLLAYDALAPGRLAAALAQVLGPA